MSRFSWTVIFGICPISRVTRQGKTKYYCWSEQSPENRLYRLFRLLGGTRYFGIFRGGNIEDLKAHTIFFYEIDLIVAAKYVLDKCIIKEPDWEDKGEVDKDTVNVTLDFEFLEDWYSPWMKGRHLTSFPFSYHQKCLLTYIMNSIVSWICWLIQGLTLE